MLAEGIRSSEVIRHAFNDNQYRYKTDMTMSFNKSCHCLPGASDLQVVHKRETLMQIDDSKRYPAQKYANGNSCYLSGRFHYWIAQSRCAYAVIQDLECKKISFFEIINSRWQNPSNKLLGCWSLIKGAIDYGALILHDLRVSENDIETFLNLMKNYFNQPLEDLQKDERKALRHHVGFSQWSSASTSSP